MIAISCFCGATTVQFPAIEANPIFPVWLVVATAVSAFLIPVVLARAIWGDARYDAGRVWSIASCYFVACFALSIALGVFPALITPPATPVQLADVRWWLGLSAVLVVVVVAYGVVWPAGSWTFDRPLDLPAALCFGVLWGLAKRNFFFLFG